MKLYGIIFYYVDGSRIYSTRVFKYRNAALAFAEHFFESYRVDCDMVLSHYCVCEFNYSPDFEKRVYLHDDEK